MKCNTKLKLKKIKLTKLAYSIILILLILIDILLFCLAVYNEDADAALGLGILSAFCTMLYIVFLQDKYEEKRKSEQIKIEKQRTLNFIQEWLIR